ncbi:MAG: hypothetical protein H7841_18085, partial [Magnetospirillum sp. WYHS-4]
MKLARLAALLLLAWPVGAAPPSQERLFAAPPAGWTAVRKEFKEGRRLHEYLPPGQTAKDWTERVTVQVFEGMLDVPAVTFAMRMADGVRESCERYEGQDPDSRQVNGYEVSLLLLECRRPAPDAARPQVVPRRIEVLMSTVIRGREGIYVVQRAWRGDQPGGGHPFYSRPAREAWLAFMGTVELCDLADRAAPCKSLGMPSHAEALAFLQPFQDQLLPACPYVLVVAVRPDTAQAVARRQTVPMVVGARPFGDAEQERKMVDLIVRSARANDPAEAREAAMAGHLDQFRRANPEASA